MKISVKKSYFLQIFLTNTNEIDILGHALFWLYKNVDTCQAELSQACYVSSLFVDQAHTLWFFIVLRQPSYKEIYVEIYWERSVLLAFRLCCFILRCVCRFIFCKRWLYSHLSSSESEFAWRRFPNIWLDKIWIMFYWYRVLSFF